MHKLANETLNLYTHTHTSAVCPNLPLNTEDYRRGESVIWSESGQKVDIC